MPERRCRRSMDFRDVFMVCPMIKFPCANALVGDAGFPRRDTGHQYAAGTAVNLGTPRTCLGRRAAAMEDCI